MEPSAQDQEAQLENDRLEREWMEQRAEEMKIRQQRALENYKNGEPNFSRKALEDLDRQLSSGGSHVVLQDLFGHPQEYSLIPPSFYSDPPNAYMIGYTSVRQAMEYDGSEHSIMCGIPSPLEIRHTWYQNEPYWTIEQAQTAFMSQQNRWLKISTHMSLKHIFETVNLPTNITKVVCFGLGSIDRIRWIGSERMEAEEEERGSTHALLQHCAALSLKTWAEGRCGKEVQCLVQDPVYNDLDKVFLPSIGITIVEDPKGFLEVDENTLVFSVGPNVPVREIIAEIAQPAVMVWDKVQEDSVLTTDPVSRRVWELVQQYEEFDIPACDEITYSLLSVYVRKATSAGRVTELASHGQGLDS